MSNIKPKQQISVKGFHSLVVGDKNIKLQIHELLLTGIRQSKLQSKFTLLCLINFNWLNWLAFRKCLKRDKHKLHPLVFQ